MYRLYCCFPLFLILFIAGCTSVPPIDNGYVSSVVSDRIDSQTEWYRGCGPDDEIKRSIQCLLERELTADAAIQIALLNNPKIQASFEELGIAQAGLIEAGLLSNPSFEVEIRYPHRVGLKTNIEYLITSSLLDIVLIPLRTRLATTEFEQTKLRVANEILNLAFEVRQSYYELLAERQKIKYAQSIVELVSISREIVSKQSAVGNVNNFELQLIRSKLLEAELQLKQVQAVNLGLEEKLKSLLGLRQDMCLRFPESVILEMDYQGYDLCDLEAIALNERLDLKVAHFEVVRLRQMLGMKEWWTYTNLQGGVAGERDPDGTNLIGPGFAVELPIFNYGQAARLRLLAQLRQAQDRLDALEIQILSEVREAHKVLMSYVGIVNDYRSCLLPLQDEILVSSEAFYNVAGLGIDKLLEQKRQEVMTKQGYLESVKYYLVARVKLDRALGGYLSRLMVQDVGSEGEGAQ